MQRCETPHMKKERCAGLSSRRYLLGKKVILCRRDVCSFDIYFARINLVGRLALKLTCFLIKCQ